MRVKITQGYAWAKGMEGRVFEVIKDDCYPGGFVYLLAEDYNNPDTSSCRYISPDDCELVPDEPTELATLRAELVRTQEALARAGELIEVSQPKVYTMQSTMTKGMDRYRQAYKAFAAALDRLEHGETG